MQVGGTCPNCGYTDKGSGTSKKKGGKKPPPMKSGKKPPFGGRRY